MQWFKGSNLIQNSAKYQEIFQTSETINHDVALEIKNPDGGDGGDYKCIVKNDIGQLQAKLNLNIESEPSDQPKAAASGEAPTFTEKPKITTLKDGKLVQLIVRYKSVKICDCQWFFKETQIKTTSKMKIYHEKTEEEKFECRLEIEEPSPDMAGMYKCLVANEKGEINANLMLNIEVAAGEAAASKTTEEKTRKTSQTMSVKKERRRSVILQCAVSGQKDVEIQWYKEGKQLETTEQKKSSRYSVEKKVSEQNETMVQLEILDVDLKDSGVYELHATSSEGTTQKQAVQLTEEAVKMTLKAEEEGEKKKKKKKKKVSKKAEKKEVLKPEVSSFLRNMVSRNNH